MSDLENLVTAWMSQDNFRMYHVDSARILGSVNAAIFLSDLIAYHKYFKKHDLLKEHPKHGKGWVPYSFDKCEERTALSTQEQKTAIHILESEGIIIKVLFNVPAEKHFRIDFDVVATKLFSKNLSSLVKSTNCVVEIDKLDRLNQQTIYSNETSNEMSYEKEIYKETPSSGKSKTAKKQEEPFVLKLSEDERKKLEDEFGKDLAECKIFALENHCNETGTRYKDHYRTIKGWCLEQKLKLPTSKQQLSQTLMQKNLDYFKRFSEKNQHLIKANLVSLCGENVEITQKGFPYPKILSIQENGFVDQLELNLRKCEYAFLRP